MGGQVVLTPRRFAAALLALVVSTLAARAMAQEQPENSLRRPHRLTAGVADQLLGQLAPDGKTLYYVSSEDASLVAASVDGSGAQFQVKGVTTLFPVNVFQGPRVTGSFDVSADGRFLINSAGEVSGPRLAVVSNWTSELPR